MEYPWCRSFSEKKSRAATKNSTDFFTGKSVTKRQCDWADRKLIVAAVAAPQHPAVLAQVKRIAKAEHEPIKNGVILDRAMLDKGRPPLARRPESERREHLLLEGGQWDAPPREPRDGLKRSGIGTGELRFSRRVDLLDPVLLLITCHETRCGYLRRAGA
jgi:hypothetical protein